MKTTFTVAVSMVAGAALGAAITGLNAQSRAPGAYAVVDITEITDVNIFRQQLLPKVPPESLAPFGGRYIVRSESFTAVDGTPPARFIVIGFDSLDRAKAWNASGNQQEVNSLRMKSTKSREFLVEALPN